MALAVEPECRQVLLMVLTQNKKCADSTLFRCRYGRIKIVNDSALS